MNIPFPRRDPGSFRDPGGTVFIDGNRVLRTVTDVAAPAYQGARDSGLLADLVKRGLLLPLEEIDQAEVGSIGADARILLQHPLLNLVSYPYEWCFEAHRRAALLHLDVHLRALQAGFTLSDATAYNIQFQGPAPVFIDHLSIRPYRPGELWAGHRQFCMQFLNPLLLHVHGIRPNAWFRGTLEGIAPEDLARILPRSSWLSWTVLTHVVMQASLQRRASNTDSAKAERMKQAKLPLGSFVGMLNGLRSFIQGLKWPEGATEWSEYAETNSYDAEETATKRAFVASMVEKARPRLLWDIGCNTGDFSVLALESGAGNVVGWDFDHGALNKAYRRATSQDLRFLPLWLDAANPSPNQGWAQRERRGFAERCNADALIALAFIHHIAIGRNVPLAQAVDWLVGLAPVGVIEFPTRADPMVQRLLQFRDIPFDDYGEQEFMTQVQNRARIVRTDALASGRRTLLVWYDRTQ